ncbi:hypothetical protein J2T60_001412 [Natronospira proteinivora]|uniref:Uncharacterized protein n=1 Tax=Natronospira proteinivora TaxID=1807133 RepID=A0ABT1GBY0_9GAMM|nr:hypothetical protein [Natronospira proteinivora]MCP1727447.1 hypothetical protein [Natronospira proteinivora]
MKKQTLFPLMATAVCLSPFSVNASGGHWLVDDAAVIPPQTFGVEAWYEDFGSSADAFTVQPAYAFANGLEVTGVIESVSMGSGRDEGYGLEGKYLWRDFEAGDDFGLGLVITSAFDDSASLDEIMAYVPVTFPLADGDWLVHVNVGVMQDRASDDDETSGFYGVGSQLAIGGGVEWIAEVLESTEDDTFAQTGFRFALGQTDGVLDVSYGWNLDNSDDDWVTLGFAWEF